MKKRIVKKISKRESARRLVLNFGFRRGVEFAQFWASADEILPNDIKSLLENYEDYFLTKNATGEMDLAVKYEYGFFLDKQGNEIKEVKFWRPAEIDIDKELSTKTI
jgi:hypothetical protein